MEVKAPEIVSFLWYGTTINASQNPLVLCVRYRKLSCATMREPTVTLSRYRWRKIYMEDFLKKKSNVGNYRRAFA